MFQEDLKVIHAVRFHTRSDLSGTAHCRGWISQGSRWNWVAMEWIDMKGGKKRSAKNWGKNPELELSKKNATLESLECVFFVFVDIGRQHVLGDPKCWDNPHVVKYEHCFQTPSSWYCWKLVVCLSSCKNLWNLHPFSIRKSPEQWIIQRKNRWVLKLLKVLNFESKSSEKTAQKEHTLTWGAPPSQ